MGPAHCKLHVVSNGRCRSIGFESQTLNLIEMFALVYLWLAGEFGASSGFLSGVHWLLQ